MIVLEDYSKLQLFIPEQLRQSYLDSMTQITKNIPQYFKEHFGEELADSDFDYLVEDLANLDIEFYISALTLDDQILYRDSPAYQQVFDQLLDFNVKRDTGWSTLSNWAKDWLLKEIHNWEDCAGLDAIFTQLAYMRSQQRDTSKILMVQLVCAIDDDELNLGPISVVLCNDLSVDHSIHTQMLQ